MGLEIATIAAIAGAATSVVGLAQAESGRRSAKRAQERSRSEQMASNASQAAAERRQQIREERVRRAKILQSAEGTGVGGSSGAIGSIGSLSTQLGSNIGTNLGALQTSSQLSIFAQQEANAVGRQQTGGQLFSLGSSVFSAAGGFNQLKDLKNFKLGN